MVKFFDLFIFGFLAQALLQPQAVALPSREEVKKRIARTNVQLTIIGDSISAGAMAGTQLGETPPELIGALVAAVMTRDPNAFLNATINPQFAYPDGEGSWSLRQQLMAHKGAAPKRLDVNNDSAPGRAMSDMTEDRIRRMKTVQDRDAEQEILLMLGSNDFCQGKSPEAYRKSASAVLRSLEKEYPRAKVYVAAVPPIDQLTKLGSDLVLGQVTCESVQRLYCDRMYADEARSVIQSYNESLRKLVKGKSGYKFIDMPQNLTLDRSLLAADCFHPGVEGHRKLATNLATQMLGTAP